MKIRKQESELTLNDLKSYPAWEYALDEEDNQNQNERTVRPYLKLEPLNPQDAYLIVRAKFRLFNGTVLLGTIIPKKIGLSVFSQTLIPYDLDPVILTERGEVHFCYGYQKPNEETVYRNYKILGQPPNTVFPIRVEADVEIINGIAEGTLEGFLYFNSEKRAFNLTENDQRYVR